MIIEPVLRWILSGLLLLIWGALILKLLRLKVLSPAQRKVKVALNTLLFVVAVLFLFQPVRPEKKGTLLIYDNDIPGRVVDSLKKAREVKQSIAYKEFRRQFRKYPDHRFFFLGQAAEPRVLSHLAGKEVQWIPYFAEGALQDIHWQGILRKGELQTVSGKIQLSAPGKIKLVYGEKTLDSLSLETGFNAFRLSFPVFAEGRNVISLQLDQRLLQDIAFYAHPAPPLAIVMLQDHPDFESRILAGWLGAQGHYVEISTPVAWSVIYEGLVNKNRAKAAPDLVIATPAQAADTRVRKAVTAGKSVLFLGLEEVPDALSRINRATGTAFSARRVSTQESLPLKNGLTALPFELNNRPDQRRVGAFPVSFQKNGGRVAVSLLNETFPLRLSDDTLTYSEIWSSIIAALDVSDSVKVRVAAPVFKNVPAEVTLLTAENALWPDKDTLSLRLSPVNPAKKSGKYTFSDTGWKALSPAGEVYVEDSPLASAGRWKSWLQANESLLREEAPSGERPLSAGIWFWAFLLCLAALWVEAKFRY